MRANKHFLERCQQRGITRTNTQTLYRELVKACSDPVKYADFVEFVVRGLTPEDRGFYRFRVEEGVFYAFVKADGTPVTVVDGRQINMHKLRAKGRRIPRGAWEEMDVLGTSVKGKRKFSKRQRGAV
ncbi:hypothetical protein IQ03_04810 [Gemmobacter caeni]|uniref:Uncharacterized protein n=1 Tax=Gemmobacter caeni TaxID=589035 RepID=A0A2T6AZ78_9RHOB|nr:hypothetical protein [Gemmobacter caeni]PTX49114.1 hypothetical protein C8N34_108224 [Gemmobacter caeni]TWI93451.1 hypothetical protein IQ03_04810 [Gemmobacter caeni]